MAKFQAVRSFPIGNGETVRRGSVLTDPDWDNLKTLVSSGLLQKVDDSTEDPFQELTEIDLTDIKDLPQADEETAEEPDEIDNEISEELEVDEAETSLIPSELSGDEPETGTVDEMIPDEVSDGPKRRGRKPQEEK